MLWIWMRMSSIPSSDQEESGRSGREVRGWAMPRGELE